MIWLLMIVLQIVGTSKNFEKKMIRMDIGGSDSDESMNGSRMHKQVIRNKVQSFTPSTPPQNAATMNYRSAKRRKGVPRRAPTGGLLIGY